MRLAKVNEQNLAHLQNRIKQARIRKSPKSRREAQASARFGTNSRSSQLQSSMSPRSWSFPGRIRREAVSGTTRTARVSLEARGPARRWRRDFDDDDDDDDVADDDAAAFQNEYDQKEIADADTKKFRHGDDDDVDDDDGGGGSQKVNEA
nr:hypothetical protein BaRGS_025287 [Batillaria attramentaria]